MHDVSVGKITRACPLNPEDRNREHPNELHVTVSKRTFASPINQRLQALWIFWINHAHKC